MEKAERLLSLDVFRGATVAAMIMVNNPGSWETVYSPLQHAKWDGCTPTDLVFPFFLFIVGVSINLALGNMRKKGKTDNELIMKALGRSAKIFGLGLFLALFPFFDFSTVRIPGVLQRIALVFLICAIIYLKTNWKTQVYLLAFFLLLYWVLMTLMPVPGVGAANLQPETNLGAWLDRLLLNGHLWSHSKTWDPEGVLGTMPAVGTGILGLLTGQLLGSQRDTKEKLLWLFSLGGVLIVAGMWWGLIFPINKALWTSSYVLYTAGLGMQVLAFFYWMIDVQGYKSWTPPFVAFGVNAITAYFAAGIVVETLGVIQVPYGTGTTNLYNFLYQMLFPWWLSPYNASLAGAITCVFLFFIPIWIMYKKNLIIKV
jgi:predicted acyltransferase